MYSAPYGGLGAGYSGYSGGLTTITGPDLNGNGIPDVLEQPSYGRGVTSPYARFGTDSYSSLPGAYRRPMTGTWPDLHQGYRRPYAGHTGAYRSPYDDRFGGHDGYGGYPYRGYGGGYGTGYGGGYGGGNGGGYGSPHEAYGYDSAPPRPPYASPFPDAPPYDYPYPAPSPSMRSRGPPYSDYPGYPGPNGSPGYPGTSMYGTGPPGSFGDPRKSSMFSRSKKKKKNRGCC
mmetsp:Transcript_44066/g.116536  ORF Transcript_44066/g.116536 Transcript_44066/m.116536 type:complete len:231 (-) Transcript_44066:117-809(-)